MINPVVSVMGILPSSARYFGKKNNRRPSCSVPKCIFARTTDSRSLAIFGNCWATHPQNVLESLKLLKGIIGISSFWIMRWYSASSNVNVFLASILEGSPDTAMRPSSGRWSLAFIWSISTAQRGEPITPPTCLRASPTFDENASKSSTSSRILRAASCKALTSSNLFLSEASNRSMFSITSPRCLASDKSICMSTSMKSLSPCTLETRITPKRSLLEPIIGTAKNFSQCFLPASHSFILSECFGGSNLYVSIMFLSSSSLLNLKGILCLATHPVHPSPIL